MTSEVNDLRIESWQCAKNFYLDNRVEVCYSMDKQTCEYVLTLIKELRGLQSVAFTSEMNRHTYEYTLVLVEELGDTFPFWSIINRQMCEHTQTLVQKLRWLAHRIEILNIAFVLTSKNIEMLVEELGRLVDEEVKKISLPKQRKPSEQKMLNEVWNWPLNNGALPKISI